MFTKPTNLGPDVAIEKSGILGYLMGWKGASGHGSASTAMEVMSSVDARGKEVLIVGGLSPVALEVAYALLSRGARVVLACRETEKGKSEAQKLRSDNPSAQVAVMHCDLSTLAGAMAFVEAFKVWKGWRVEGGECKALQSAHGVDFIDGMEEGPTNNYATKRTFGRPDSEIRVLLETATLSCCAPSCPRSYSQTVDLFACHQVWLQLEENQIPNKMVWIQLEEKRIPYRMVTVEMGAYGEKAAWFLEKNPKGLIPVVELDGEVVTESAAIMAVLEAKFPEHNPLIPPEGSEEKKTYDEMMTLVDSPMYSTWSKWIANTIPEEKDAARKAFEDLVDVAEAKLAKLGGPFFLGEMFSLVDVNLIPSFERMVASSLYFKGLNMREGTRWPNLARWYEAMDNRDSYLGTKGDYYTDMDPAGERFANVIDGEEGNSWKLPLSPLSATSFPEPYAREEDPVVHRLEAAAALIRNSGPIARFALRGPGKPGPKEYMCPLADPQAIPALEYEAAMDVALRHVAHALLASMGGSGMPSATIIEACEYLNTRIGVPRDMRMPAARQLRAHINWAADMMGSS
eukprot:gene31719-6917_t